MDDNQSLSIWFKIFLNVSLYKMSIFNCNNLLQGWRWLYQRGCLWNLPEVYEMRPCADVLKESHRGFTHQTLINQNEDEACGRCCMDYSAINVVKCRIYGGVDAYDIYIADEQTDRWAIILSFINIITICRLLSHCANPQKFLFIWNPST